MKYVSEHGTTWSIWVALVVAVAFAIATDKLARGNAARTWEVFVGGSVVFFSLNVLGNYYFNFRISGEPSRLLPELDMVYIMAMVILLRWMWNRPGVVLKAAAAVIVAAAFSTTVGYVGHAWHMFPLWPDYQNRVEYKITDWIWRNMPDSRLLSSGSVRFWYDAWHDLAEIGGGSDQGLLNGMVEPAQWETNLGAAARPSILWMQSMGVDGIYVSDARSQEVFKDFTFPKKFEGVLSAAYDDGQGNVIYRVPRRYPARARVVESARLDALKPPRFNDDVEYLQAYVDTIEKGPDAPVSLERNGTDAMRIHAAVHPGQSVLVQESYDPAWHAWSGGKAVPVRKDSMGMMVLDPPPGNRDITLMFVTPLENRVGRVITIVTLLIILSLLPADARRERRA